jgi:hypothetical protein
MDDDAALEVEGRDDSEIAHVALTFSLALVMPGFMPGIHVFLPPLKSGTWMAGTSPAMTWNVGRAKIKTRTK